MLAIAGLCLALSVGVAFPAVAPAPVVACLIIPLPPAAVVVGVLVALLRTGSYAIPPPDDIDGAAVVVVVRGVVNVNVGFGWSVAGGREVGVPPAAAPAAGPATTLYWLCEEEEGV